MINGSVARRYARALLAAAGDSLVRAHADLTKIVRSLEASPEAMAFFEDPTAPRERKIAFVESLVERAQPHPMVGNFLRLLASRDRLHGLPAIAGVFDELVSQRLGRVRAEVISAVGLSDEALTKVRDAIGRATSKEVELASRVDEDLLGGLVARVGSTVFDGSLRSQLASLRNELLDRA